MIDIKKPTIFVFFFFIVFCFTNIMHINSNDSKVFLYDKNELYEEKDVTLYFYDLYSLELIDIFSNLELEIIDIKSEENLYNINEILLEGNTLSKLVSNMHLDYSNKLISKGYELEGYNIYNNGFKITSMKVRGLLKEIIKLEDKTQII